MIDVAFDMDGVLVDMMGPICKEFGFTHRDVVSFKTSESFGEELGKKIKEFYNRDGFFAGLKPLDGAVELLERLRSKHKDNIKMWILSRPAESLDSWKGKILWCQKHIPWIEERIILTKDKSLCSPDIFIDDYVRSFEGSKANVKILLAQPWNINETGDFITAYNYEDVEIVVDDYIKRINQ